jgi:hypothetical protein
MVMTDYIIVKDDLLNLFVDTVNEKLKEGYTTIGGVSTRNNGGFICYMQAMAKLGTKYEILDN